MTNHNPPKGLILATNADAAKLTVKRPLAFALARSATVLLLAACALVASAANAQTPQGDPVKGRAFALGNCTSCHEVESRRASPPMLPNAPPLAAVANAEGTTAMSLRAFLNSSHKTMPNFILSPSQQRDVISYILSLRTKR